MFDALSSKLEIALDRVRGRGRLDAATVDATLKEIRLALLEADVNFKVVKGIVERLRERLVGEEVAKALNPAQQVVKAVSQELERALGGESAGLALTGKPAVIMLAGLQGSGKTTAAGKLAKLLKSKGRHPMLVACDLQRPAAVQQLKVNAERVGVHVYAPVTAGDPVPVARESIAKARESGCDVVIVDTAGRLHVDEELMGQAAAIREAVQPDETLFVIDAMIGQEAVNVARAFLDGVGFDGVILSKLDGDARGGAALSVREVTGKPIKFASIGEKMEDFEAFHPDRMASRILGMGDVMTLIEKAEATYSEEEAQKAETALMSGEFTLEDFLEQMQMLKRMGPLQGLLGMMPGMGKQLKDVDVDDKQVARVEAIIRSMTPKERREPKILNGRRRKRIAAGSGTTVPEVNRLVKQFAEVQKIMKSASKMAGMQGTKPKGVKGAKAQAAALRQLQSGGQLPGGMPPGLGGGGAAGGGLGGFAGLQPAPKKGKRR
ncbi:signal recognition particle protein [Egicoccus halophilus]|uniref:Signal recognition particle protein n=1 Tax=Egicoccus halophilus TaxID=1670830 RepID=A0A8J3AAN2_9ACTN|nr:signal recognition particle protein [Egicoccus halophilus]GGI06468.1 signal recognition particle protein [Egicoccus halophilus]